VPNCPFRRALAAFPVVVVLALMCAPLAARADSDVLPGVDPTTVGLQPIKGAIPAVTPAPGEPKLTKREDGTFQALPSRSGRNATFVIVAREAPWTLRPGLTVLAKTYNGVVPGPTLVVQQGDRVAIDFRNAMTIPDTVHLHGIHGGPDSMDGVAGISQPMVEPGGRFRYTFTANQPGTFIYHSHDNEQTVNSGLYGAIVVLPAHPRPEERVQRDDVELLSSWSIQSMAENHFTINGKEYPATNPIEVRRGDRVRLRWINMSSENVHTMHTHGHDQLVIARDAQPAGTRDLQDTVLIGPGQRLDTVVTADQQPGNWAVHCHVLDHAEDAAGMPAGLITTIHYAGTPQKLPMMAAAMHRHMPDSSNGNPRGPLSFGTTALLGAFAGLTIFLGLPIARARRLSPQTIAALNALAIGILLYLIVEIAGNATSPLVRALGSWRLGVLGHGAPSPLPAAMLLAYVGGLLAGIVGLGAFATRLAKAGAARPAAERPLVLAGMIAVGIGAHNFAEGLAIGASAAAGATAIAFSLILGFALHNATEGFGIAAPLAGADRPPTWPQLGLAGVVAGGPTFVGSVIGYQFSSPVLQTFFLTIAVGALIFVVGELWGVLKRSGLTVMSTSMLAAGFVIALGTEIVIDFSGG
jgi:ZIP family zinc transporter